MNAPYCDAMFIDNPIIDLINESELNFKEKYNTLSFSPEKTGIHL